MTIGDLVIESQGVGVAEIAFGFDGVDGILGCVIRPRARQPPRVPEG